MTLATAAVAALAAISTASAPSVDQMHVVKIGYRGECEIVPRAIIFEGGQWHLSALDLEKNEPCDICLKEITSWSPKVKQQPASAHPAAAEVAPPPLEQAKVVSFHYTNWEGRSEDRTVMPIQIYFGSNEYHKEPQWILLAMDAKRLVLRTFTLKDISPSNQAVASAWWK
jgi:predicted DNA-binding transcriptional regulator YafY